MHPLLIKVAVGAAKVAWKTENERRQKSGLPPLETEVARTAKKTFRKASKVVRKALR